MKRVNQSPHSLRAYRPYIPAHTPVLDLQESDSQESDSLPHPASEGITSATVPLLTGQNEVSGIPHLPVANADHLDAVQSFHAAAAMDPNAQQDSDRQDTAPDPVSKLITAAAEGRRDILKSLWSEACTTEVVETLLLHAAEGKHLEAVEYLVEMGANPTGETLWKIAGFGDPAILNAIWKPSFEPDMTYVMASPDGPQRSATLIVEAVAKGNLAVVDFLLDKGADRNQRVPVVPMNISCLWGVKQRKSDTSLLAFASQQTDTKVFQRLWHDAGTDKRRGARLSVCLELAVLAGRIENVRFLLDQKVVWNNPASSAIYSAIVFNSPRNASETEKLEIVRMLWQDDTDPEAGDGVHTPLMAALMHGYCDIARFLIEEGANLEATSRSEDNMLMYAVRSGRMDAVRLILSYSRNIHQINEYEESALSLAAEASCGAEMLELLLEKQVGGPPLRIVEPMIDTTTCEASQRKNSDLVIAATDVWLDHVFHPDPQSSPLGLGDSAKFDDALGFIDFLIEQIELKPTTHTEPRVHQTLCKLGIRRAVVEVIRLRTQNFSEIQTFLGQGVTSHKQKQIYCAIMLAGMEQGENMPLIDAYENQNLSSELQLRMNRVAEGQAKKLAGIGRTVLESVCGPVLNMLTETCVKYTDMTLTVIPRLYDELLEESGLYGPLVKLIVDSLQPAITAVKNLPPPPTSTAITFGEQQREQRQFMEKMLARLLPEEILKGLGSAAYGKEIFDASNNIPDPVSFYQYLTAQQLILKNACEDMLIAEMPGRIDI